MAQGGFVMSAIVGAISKNRTIVLVGVGALVLAAITLLTAFPPDLALSPAVEVESGGEAGVSLQPNSKEAADYPTFTQAREGSGLEIDVKQAANYQTFTQAREGMAGGPQGHVERDIPAHRLFTQVREQ
jgi:hypothetical protein